MPWLRLTSWERYQHYRHRAPPWIKLHVDLMRSEEWVMADDAGRVLMVSLMLLASRHNGYVKDDPEYIRRVACLSQTPDLEPLLACGFIERADDASATLAQGTDDASTRAPEGSPRVEKSRKDYACAREPVDNSEEEPGRAPARVDKSTGEKRPRPGNGGWPHTDAGWVHLGESLGVTARVGELMAAYQARVKAAKDRARAPP